MPAITWNTVYEYVKVFLSMFGIYVAWVFVHYMASHIYVHWCVPATIVGFLLSPFLAPAPHCQALRWAIYNGGNSILAMWVLFGMWIMKFLMPVAQR
jgi:hypothetical protein